MLKFKVFVFYSLIPCAIFAQKNISGKIYGEKKVAKYVKISNLTQKLTTFSNEKGEFIINAIQNDSISFSSVFHEEKWIKINKDYFDKVVLIHLEEKINKLEGLVVNSKFKAEEFNTEKFNLEFNNQIKDDVKRNPYYYEKQSDGRLDLIKASNYIGSLIGKLFKKKENISSKTPSYMSHNDLKNLFKEQSFFNDNLLVKELNIPIENKFLFFDFCEEQKINVDILNSKNEFLILDLLMKYSTNFRKNL